MSFAHTDGDGCLCERCVWDRALDAAYQDGTIPDHDNAAIAILRAANAAREAELRAELQITEGIIVHNLRRERDAALAENRALREALRGLMPVFERLFRPGDEEREEIVAARAALTSAQPPTDPEDAR